MPRVSLAVVAREWTRIGLTGFGGPPAHIALLRRLVVERAQWMSAREFEDANAACSLLPGPASTQLAILCAYRLAGVPGAVVGGLGFIAPAVILILALASVFLAEAPPVWIRGAGAGAGAAVAAVAVHAALQLAGPSVERARERRVRWALYAGAGAVAAALIGSYLVLVLIACGLAEIGVRTRNTPAALAVTAPHLGGVAWTAFKVGALSFGGGFVIVPLMQGDAVHTYHWMSNTQFANAVALGQVTPGPVVATVAAVGYAADKVPGGLLAAVIAFTPSFVLVILAARRYEQLRSSPTAQAFLDGAGPAAIGAIAGAAIPLASAIKEWWQVPILAAAAGLLGIAKRGVVPTLLGAGTVGALAALAGAAVP